MRYQWKLLLLMLTVSILPLLMMRSVGLNMVRKMGDNFAGRSCKLLTENAERQLKSLVDDYTALIWRGRELYEAALMYQAAAAEQCLSEPPPASAPIFFTEDFETGKGPPPGDAEPSLIHLRWEQDRPSEALTISYGHQAFKPAPGQNREAALPQARRLAAMLPNYQRIYRLMQERRLFWQHIALAGGLFSTYPAAGRLAADLDPRELPWYQGALEQSKEIWTAPYVDPATHQIVLAVSTPIKTQSGTILGVTALVIPANSLLENERLLQNIPPGTHSFMTYLAQRPDTGQKGLAVLSSSGNTPQAKPTLIPLMSRWLTSDDADQWQALLNDCTIGVSRIRRLSYEGRDCMWAYGPLSNRSHLVLISPYEEILKPAHLSDQYVKAQIDRVVTITGIVILILVGIVFFLSLTFARTVTKPIRTLEKGALLLAEGDFNARVAIHSNDEFGRMGQVFNQVGPQLQEHYRMRHALSLAMEVQQNLLPKTLPVIAGLDIAGASVYCDETGGDYYDFLTRDDQPKSLAVVVGDVSGHGLPSALLMAAARALLRQRYALEGTLSQVITDVNRMFSKDVADSGRFLTLFFCEIRPGSRSIAWVNAGHDPALLYDAPTDRFEELAGKSLPLGVNAAGFYPESSRSLDNGRLLAIGTDGIWETRNPAGEMFGKERFRALIRTHAHFPADAILQAIIAAVDEFRGPQSTEDDITLIVVKACW